MSELTPAQVEDKLRRLVTDLTRAQQELSTARDAETETEIALKRARLALALSDECPKPSRGGVTVAQRDEWIESHCTEQWEAHRRAETAREIAQDALRTNFELAKVVQSLNASVRTAYGMAGVA